MTSLLDLTVPRARNEDTMWSKVVQDYNSLQSNVLSSLPVDSQTSRLDSADRLAPETDPKWRRVDEELDFFRMQNERGTDLDRELSKRCHLLPLKVWGLLTVITLIDFSISWMLCETRSSARMPSQNRLLIILTSFLLSWICESRVNHHLRCTPVILVRKRPKICSKPLHLTI